MSGLFPVYVLTDEGKCGECGESRDLTYPPEHDTDSWFVAWCVGCDVGLVEEPLSDDDTEPEVTAEEVEAEVNERND